MRILAYQTTDNCHLSANRRERSSGKLFIRASYEDDEPGAHLGSFDESRLMPAPGSYLTFITHTLRKIHLSFIFSYLQTPSLCDMSCPNICNYRKWVTFTPLVVGPDLWKIMLLKCSIIMVFSWPLLSLCKIASPFRQNSNLVISRFLCISSCRSPTYGSSTFKDSFPS